MKIYSRNVKNATTSAASVLLSSRNDGGLPRKRHVGNGQILTGKQAISTPPLLLTPRQTHTKKRPSVFISFSHPHSPLDCKADDVVMESSGTPLVWDVRHDWRRNAFGTTRSCANVRHCRHPSWEVLRCHVLIADEV